MPVCDCWLLTADIRLAEIAAQKSTPEEVPAVVAQAQPFDPQLYSHAMTIKAAEISYNDRLFLCGFAHWKLDNKLGRHRVGYVYIKEELPTCPSCIFMLKLIDKKEIL